MKKSDIAFTLLTALCLGSAVPVAYNLTAVEPENPGVRAGVAKTPFGAGPAPASVTVHTAPLAGLKDSDTVVTNVDVSLDLTPYATKSDVDAGVSLLRGKDDLAVYRASGYGEWKWTSAPTPETLAALGTVQPGTTWEGSTEWSFRISTAIGDISGYAYSEDAEPETLTFYVDVYGPDGWDDDNSGTAVCRREALSFVDSGDELAVKSDLDAMRSTVDDVYAVMAGERLVRRTGLRGQRGTGWGYVQARLADDRRYWRLRVPQLVTSPAAGANLDPGQMYQGSPGHPYFITLPLYEGVRNAYASGPSTYPNASVCYKVHYAEDVVGSYLADSYPWLSDEAFSGKSFFPPGYGLAYVLHGFPAIASGHNSLVKEVEETREPYGSDACFEADWRVGIANIDPDRPDGDTYINLRVDGRVVSASDVTAAGFSVDLAGFEPVMQTVASTSVLVGYQTPADADPVILHDLVFTNGTYSSGVPFGVYTHHSVTQRPVAFLIEPEPFSVGSGKVKFSFRNIFDLHADTTYIRYSADGAVTSTQRIRYGIRVLTPPYYIEFSSTAYGLEDNVCVYKIMSSDLDSRLVYDEESRSTWELRSSGGKLYYEEISSKDFRKEDL